jgi:MFS superfamily sulfate permease-like transporter
MPDPREIHRGATRLMSVAMIAIGIALVASTLAHGGGAIAVGVLLGVLFVAAGVLRLGFGGRRSG